LLILSRQAAADKLLRHNLKVGALVEATVTGSNKGGLEMKIKGSLKAFMPASQIDVVRIEDLDSLTGQKYICEVTEVERGDKNIVLSHRNVVERQQAEQGEKLWAELAEGQTRRGVVRSLAEYGAFVDLGGVDGLLHVSEMSWARIKHPKDILEVGQEVDVIVKSIDLEKKRIGLSLKLVAGNPWDTVEQKYLPGSHHQGRIVKLMNYGAFTELEPGVEGLIPVGEMTWAGRIRHPSDILKPGEMVEVEILDVDQEKQRISLSMKRIQGNPWDNIESKYVKDEIYSGKVVRLTEFGAFVSLEPGVDGLIHISELSDKHVNKPGEVVKEGEQVQVKVLGVDVKSQRISLSLKAAAASSVEEQETPTQESPAHAAEVRESPEVMAKKKALKPRRGGLSW
jgi:small subunit ribosomal protein S1